MGASPAAKFLTDSYVFKWQNQTFAGDLVFVVPIALAVRLIVLRERHRAKPVTA